MRDKHSCPYCGQHVVIENAPPGISVNCPNCGTGFALAAPPARKGLLKSPLYWGVVLLVIASIAAIIFIRGRSSSPKPAPTVAKDEIAPKPMTKAELLKIHPLGLWIDDFDVNKGDSPAAKQSRDSLKQAAPEMIPDVIGMFNDSKVPARRRGNAAQALGWIGSSEGPEVDVLWNGLKDGETYVRYSCIYSLRRLRVDSQKLVPKFIELLDDPDSGVRRSAADNLGEIGAPAQAALPGLEKLLTDEVQATREKADRAIKRISNPKAAAK